MKIKALTSGNLYCCVDTVFIYGQKCQQSIVPALSRNLLWYLPEITKKGGSCRSKIIAMAATLLKIVMTLFCVQVVVKFFVFFFVKYDTRKKQLDKSYGDKLSATKAADYVLLGICAFLVTLLFISEKMEYLSFITGLYVGATLIQLYFHQFHNRLPLPEDQAPGEPLSPIKIMSYSIQAFPKRPWKELVFLTILFLWGLYMLLSKGFGII